MRLKQNLSQIQEIALVFVVPALWLAWIATPMLFSLAARLGHWPARVYGLLPLAMALSAWLLGRHAMPTVNSWRGRVAYFCMLSLLFSASFLVGQVTQLLIFGE